MEGMYLSVFFELNSSYFGHQKRGLKSQFHKICNLDSKYPIFDYKVFIDKSRAKDSKEFQLQYLHSHKCAVIL
jgi:hypothetical protein